MRLLKNILSAVLLSFIFGTATAENTKLSAASFVHWLDAAHLAQAAYGQEKDMQQILLTQGYKMQQFHQLDGYSVSYAMAINDKKKHQLLIVRGTDNIENIIVNSAFILVSDEITKAKIHQGFLLSATDIFHKILPAIKADYSISTIGHSLGGAAALIVAMMLDTTGYTLDEVITFGQPKVTNLAGSNKFSHLKITRLVMPKDVVPLVPPIDPMNLMQLNIFWPQGQEVILYNANEYAITSGMTSLRRALDFLNDIPSEQHISHHFMSAYIRNIKSKLNSPLQIPYRNDFDLSDWFSISGGTKQ